jgi:chromosome segregation ATPase
LKQREKNIDNLSKELSQTKVELAQNEAQLNTTTQELTSVNNELSSTKEENSTMRTELESLKKEHSDLQNEFSITKDKLEELEPQVGILKEDFEQKERELEGVKKDLQQTISDKYIEIESLRDELTKQLNIKEAGITQAKNEVEAKNKEIEAIGLKVKSLEDYIEEAKGAPQVIEKIREILSIKGFLSDKELEDLLENIQD